MTANKKRKPDPVDEALRESFPASDPPTYSGLHSGAPDPDPDPNDSTAADPRPPQPNPDDAEKRPR